ncbi:hypothetical protein E2986_11451 [Frieseomelitta varia]|uniref:Ataxin-2 C-terminal domain-containing protein n=1 Tax=Frieseomelitta varia TaxID=561572 RepID=A0A833RMX0_9HYME|nr:hypothetical protein E2986_11451 [Frieseomelitta varia]
MQIIQVSFHFGDKLLSNLYYFRINVYACKIRGVKYNCSGADFLKLLNKTTITKALRHAVIHEPDNVAESEDSEDEWNYYRVEPNKEKDSASTRVDEPEETKGEVSEPPVKDIEPKIQPEGVQDIKCDNRKEEESQPKLIDTEISTEDRTEESERPKDCCAEEQDRLKDMDFQLNPDAKEFVPVSPQFVETRMNLVEDYPVSGSPFKQVPQMDDIQVPSQSEFEKEVCQRPREVDTEESEYQNGANTPRIDNYTDLMSDQQRASNLLSGTNMDDSEISSTKAEFGDESAISFLTTSEFHRTGISTIDESFSSSERDYDIAKDPMAMSFTPSDFEAAFDKGVDLNAVHNLSNTDLEDQNGSIVDREEEEEKQQQQQGEQELARESPKVETTAESKQLSDNEQLATSEKTVDELVNLSSQREHSEDNFIEHADETKAETNTVADLLDLQPESSQLEQEEIAKYDHSPLTDNYSAGFESEKEPVSVDTNEQPLSPSSIDIDETKPIDEASEDAALPASDLQKEVCSNEADTPSSLSPVPDPMESDSGPAIAESAQVQSSKPHEPLLHLDTSQLVADDRYNFQSYGNVELISHQRSPSMEVADVCQASRTKETVDPYQAYSTEAGNAFELVQQDFASANAQFDEKEDDKLIGMTSTVQQMNLLDFTEEQDARVKSPQFQSELTPPLSPQRPKEQPIDDVICSFVLESSVERSKDVVEETNVTEEDDKAAEVTESAEEPMEPAVPTKTIEPVVDQVQEPTLNLSDSMQEFTGLENQLKPLEEEILKSKVDEQLEKEVSRKEESVDIVAEPEKLSEHTIEVECKNEVEELLPEINKSEIKEPEIVQLKSEEPQEPQEPQEIEIKKAQAKELEGKELENKESEIKESEIKESKVEETVQVAENKAATAAITTTTTQSKTKSKVSAAKPTKTTSSKAAAPKSMPTSPSKAAVAATRTSKKPSTTTLSRPKDLDAPKRSTVSTTATVASKPAISKAASKTTTSTTATKPITRTSASSVSKSKPAATTALSKATLAEKKPTMNGDVKPPSKSTATKPSSKSSQPATKNTLVKTSTTRMLTGTTTTTAKPRPTSASTTTVKSSTTSKSSSSTTTNTSNIAATTSPRPKTAPAVGSNARTRLSVSKSPMIDKQVKETANKQISMGRTSTAACKTSRLSSNTTTTTTVRRVSSSTKTTTAASPTKRSTTVTKVSKISSSGKTTANNKGKVLQNGVSENVEINTIIDDVPKKDLSPVVAPNDNQLIMSSD